MKTKKIQVAMALATAFIMVSCAAPKVPKESMTDPRDGNKYDIVKIGDQFWMANNLNFTTPENSWCYADDPANCTKYGRLYNWESAQKSCPSGWHLPSIKEIETLFETIKHKGEDVKTTKGWKSGGNGSDIYGFSALPAGIRVKQGSYYGEGEETYFWSSSGDDEDIGHYIHLEDRDWISYGGGTVRNNGFSVRCLRD